MLMLMFSSIQELGILSIRSKQANQLQSSANQFQINPLPILIHHILINCPVMERITSTKELNTQDAANLLPPTVLAQTRKMISKMGPQQRMKKASIHVHDAIRNRHPRPDAAPQQEFWFNLIYGTQTSHLFRNLLYLMSYVYMYLIIIQQSHFTEKVIIESVFLFVFWVDIAMEIYHKSFEQIRIKAKFEIHSYVRFVVIILLSIDLILYGALNKSRIEDSQRIIQPFRILRCFLPILFDQQTRSNFYATLSAYRQMLLYVLFFSITIVTFAIIGSTIIHQSPDTAFDEFTSNYLNLNRMIFVTYVVATYDSYPDNQQISLRENIYYYAFWIGFIFLNMLLFTSIPGTIVFEKFRQTRSKTLLLNEIKQQHSLLLAFISLGEEKHKQYTMGVRRMSEFLLYMYKYKIRYIDYINLMINEMDKNGNSIIEANQFMGLLKLIEKNNSMQFPRFHDWQPWLSFRDYVNETFKLKTIVQSLPFQMVVAIIIVLGFANSIIYIYSTTQASIVLNEILMGLFVFELIVKMVAIGPQNFFAGLWNRLDFFLIVVGFIFQFIPQSNVGRTDALFKMGRIFHLTIIVDFLYEKTFLFYLDIFGLYQSIKSLFRTLIVMFPIISKFFSFYLILFYFLGVIGLEIFTDSELKDPTAAYSQYAQFSHFKNFINTQFIFVQILTEAGWSLVAFDYAKRNQTVVALVMIFFFLCHISIALIITTFVKGIFWEVYFDVSKQYKQNQSQQIQEQAENQNFKKLRAELIEIQKSLTNNQVIIKNTPLKRQLFQNKLNDLILRSFLEKHEAQKKKKKEQQNQKQDSFKILNFLGGMMNQKADENVNQDDIESIKSMNTEQRNYIEAKRKVYQSKSKQNIQTFQKIQFQDIFEEEDHWMKKWIIPEHQIKNPAIQNSAIFLRFLSEKVKKITFENSTFFDVQTDELGNEESIKFHMSQFRCLFNLQPTLRQRRLQLLDHYVIQGLIKNSQQQRLLKSKMTELNFNITSENTLRRVFLKETDQKISQTFTIDYFSDIYGPDFKKICSVHIEKLIKQEAFLTYALRNIMKFHHIENFEFFLTLSKLQTEFSNRLLKEGSVFKYVFQLDCEEEIWFSIEYRDSTNLRIHFNKTTLWMSSKEFQEEKIYHGEDVFNWSKGLIKQEQQKEAQLTLKLFFQNFENLSLSLHDRSFFESNPKFTKYHLYFQYLNVSQARRKHKSQFRIKNIMLVILSKKEDRQDHLDYDLTHIESEHEKNQIDDFVLDQGSSKTYSKLQKIVQKEDNGLFDSGFGLPHAYIINLMNDLQAMLKSNQSNFVAQVEKCFSDQMKRVNNYEPTLKDERSE